MSSRLNTALHEMLNKLMKSALICGLPVYIIIYISVFNTSILIKTSTPHHSLRYSSSSPANVNATHILFGIAASASSWSSRKHYVEAWWRPNATRGYVFLDKVHRDMLPRPNASTSSSLPALRISKDTSMYRGYDRHKVPQAIRMARIISEILDMEEKARWYVMADDDTVFFVDNLLDVLSRYDHRDYLYIGMNSECHSSNFFHSFEMAFGGAGYVLSHPLARALAANLDVCLKRYPTLYGSDHIVQSCVADLGVSLTQEKGFHQIDLHSDVSGLLSAHPRRPVVSLHHLEQVNPMFPGMTRDESLKHLMTAARADESRLLQQSMCYHHPQKWSFSISWGYSLQIYESVIPPSALQIPLQTFTPWTTLARPFFLFNTRLRSKNPCHAPHEFFFHSVGNARRNNNHIVTKYTRARPRGLPPCDAAAGNQSAADFLSEILVLSPASKYQVIGNRRECCDVLHVTRGNAVEIKLRDCLENEILP